MPGVAACLANEHVGQVTTIVQPVTLVMTGAESSGKTTLAEDIAEHFAVPWVPEFARSYLAHPRFKDRAHDYEAADVEAIARGQCRSEASARQQTSGLLVVDTDLLVILIWMRERFGSAPAWITESVQDAALPASDLRIDAPLPSERRYVLTAPEMQWQPDPLREHPDARMRLHLLYRQALQQNSLRFIEVVGGRRQRLEAVCRWLQETANNALP